MAINEFDIQTTRRLSVGLLGASGALLLTALNMAGSAISSGSKIFASEIADSITPLFVCTGFALVALIFSEIANHPRTPESGHPHSKSNYLQSAFALIAVSGLVSLCWGCFELIGAILNATNPNDAVSWIQGLHGII